MPRALLVVSFVWAAASCTNTNNNAPVDAATSNPGQGPSGDARAAEPIHVSEGGAGDFPVSSVREPGYLWFAGAALGVFTRTETQASSDHGPGSIVVPSFPITNFHDLAFDRDGNLWTVPISGNQIVRLPAAQLATTGPPPSPDLVISSAALKSPQSLVFDAAGNLWVMSYNGAGPSVASIARFDDPRAATGMATLSPSVTINPGSGPEGVARFTQGTAIAFDAAGNLWFASVPNVIRIDRAATLQGTVSAAPAAIISSGDAYVSIAFDKTGSLWVTGATNGYFAIRIANPGALTGAVTAAPAARVHLPTGTAMFAGGMGFDPDGALWIAMSDKIVKLANPGTLTGDVTPTPAVVLGLVVSPDLASKLAFSPR